MIRLLSALLLTTLACTAQETWALYRPTPVTKDEEIRMVDRVRALLPEESKGSIHAVPTACKTALGAKQLAAAIDAGVTALPCLVLKDERGAYAALPLPGLTAESLARARLLATAPGREQATARRKLASRLYYLRALWSLAHTPEEQDTVIAAYHVAMKRTESDTTTGQHIGYYCLYPALMQQYAAEYNGAHTPRTETLLLEAIAALEAVRDADPESRLGRLAYDERERLRAARLKSRQYE